MLNLKLVDNWREALSWLSILCNFIGVSALGTMAILHQFGVPIPPDLVWIVAIATPVSSSLGRLIKQEKRPSA